VLGAGRGPLEGCSVSALASRSGRGADRVERSRRPARRRRPPARPVLSPRSTSTAGSRVAAAVRDTLTAIILGGLGPYPPPGRACRWPAAPRRKNRSRSARARPTRIRCRCGPGFAWPDRGRPVAHGCSPRSGASSIVTSRTGAPSCISTRPPPPPRRERLHREAGLADRVCRTTIRRVSWSTLSRSRSFPATCRLRHVPRAHRGWRADRATNLRRTPPSIHRREPER